MVRLAMYEKNAKAQAIFKSNKIDELENLITDFMSDSNDTRSDAKSIFEICTNKPKLDVFANKLYHVLSSSLDLNSCTISAILLRKSLINKFDTTFLHFPAETQSTLKRDLLKLVDTSVDTPTRPINKELCHTVSALAASLLPKKEWPEFLPFLFQLIASDKKRALLIGAHLAQYLGKGLKELHSVNLDQELHSVNLNKLYSVLLQCLKTMTDGEGEGEDVRIAALGAAINFILCLEQKDLVNFQDLLIEMMSTLKKAFYSGNETIADAVNTLKLLIDLAGMKPTFLRKQIVEMVETIFLMASDRSLEKGTRFLAIEFILTMVQFVLTLAEVEKTNPGLLKLGTELEINMEEMWDDNGSWQGCVDRLRILLDKYPFFTVVLEVLPAYLAAPKGQKRHAALIMLSKSIIKWNCQEVREDNGRVMTRRDNTAGYSLILQWDGRVAILGATINFIPCPDLLTMMLSMLADVLKDRDEAAVSEALELLTELVEPRFLVGQIMEWQNTMWQIANNDSLNVETRRLAIEFLLKLAQVEEIAPWLQQNVRELFEILMNMWDYINDDDPNADHAHAWESSNNYFWRQCWDMLLIAVGGNGIFYVALEVLPAYLDASEWQKRHAAFIVLTQSIKSCHETQVTIENLEQLVQMVFSRFPDAHRHVQCVAIEAIQQLATHLLRFRLHEEVMRTNFEQVMSKLLSSFQDDDPIVQNASIDAIEMLAPALGTHSQVGFHLVLPALAEVMDDFPNRKMRGSAASAILVFSEYCTRDNLMKHLDGSIRSCLIVLKEVKEFVMKIRFTNWGMFRWCKMLSEINVAWIQLWRTEERDFSPYLEILMAPAFAAAAQTYADEPWYDAVNIYKKKAMACHVLCFCVDELTTLLTFPLIDQVVDALVPFLKWYKDPFVDDAAVQPYNFKGIRIVAVSAMPKILNSAREVVESSDPEDYDHTKQNFEKLSDKVKRALNEASDVEPDEEVRYDILYALKDCEQ